MERGVDTQSFTISNTATGAVLLTIRAFDEAGDLLEGSDVANERSRTLGAGQTLTFDLETMFGQGATAGTVASVAIESKSDRTAATKIGDHSGRRLRCGFPGTGRASLFPVRPAQRRGDASRECGRCGHGGFRVPVDAHGYGRRRAGGRRAGGRIRGGATGFSGHLFGITAAAVPLAGYVRVESIEAQFRGNLVDNSGERRRSPFRR